jgi:hypothetical protein
MPPDRPDRSGDPTPKMVILSFAEVDCNELPQWTASAAGPVDLGRGRRFFTSDLQRTAVDFGKLQVFAVHFGQDCKGLWQGEPLNFNGNRCSRLWKMTPGKGIVPPGK